MESSLFAFSLPPDRIAQFPPVGRDLSRLMVVNRASGSIAIDRFFNLPEHLRRDDLLVVNDSSVARARLFGRREATGGKVEFLQIAVEPGGESKGMVGGKVILGEILAFDGDHRAEVVAKEGNRVTLRWLTSSGGAPLDEIGHLPVPPYIKRTGLNTPSESLDQKRYQTLYAKHPGSVAAPTAGLHFSPRVLASIRSRGIGIAPVTLHVGPGTFLPVTAEEIEGHHLEAESYQVPTETAEAVAAARGRGGRVIAVGTTAVRTLETTMNDEGRVEAGEGRTGLYITPGFRFRAVDALITNFHLPRSSLLVLVCAFGGRELIMEAYRTAVEEGFRFYSYGDAMLVL
jgi:S-adenosylmethionine:tRNA ribosyltransferase-isomerase